MRKWSENIPSIEKIEKVASYLDVGIERIITGKASKESLSEEEQNLIDKYRSVSETAKTMIQERAATLFDLEHPKRLSVANNYEEEDPDPEDDPLYLDLYDMPVSAGGGTYIDYTTAEPMQVPRTAQTEDANYMVRISGDSMEPRFSNGDIVLVETTSELEQGEIGIFILNSEAYIKQLGDGCLISLNKKYDPIPVSENDSCVLKGRVIGILDIKKGA